MVVKVFVFQIKMGKMTTDDVPERWRESVREELSKND